MKKKNYLHLLAIMMVAMLSVGFVSCSSDDNDDKKVDNYEPTQNLSVKDPEGTVVLNMTSGASKNYYRLDQESSYSVIYIDQANNFKGDDLSISIVSVGIVEGLTKITEIPTAGWAKSVAVIPGTGYIMRYRYSVDTVNRKETWRYARIYVVSYLGVTTEIIDGETYTYGTPTGATIKYQTPFATTTTDY